MRRFLLAASMMLAPGAVWAQPVNPPYNPGNVRITGGTISGANGSGVSVTPTGSTARTLANGLAGPFTLMGSGTSGQYDARIGVTGGGSQSGMGVAGYTAAQHSLNAYDSTIQFSIGLQAAATEYWQAQGGLTGTGGSFFATNGTPLSGNVDGNFVTQGAGNLWFGSGSGWGLEIIDPGARATGNLTVTAGTAAANPSLGSTGALDVNVPAGSTGFFRVNGLVMGGWANLKSIGSTANYPLLYGSTGAAGMQCVNAAGSGAVSCFLQAQGTGAISFGNSSGSLATFSNSDLNTAVDYFVSKASSSTTTVRVTTNAGGSVSIGGLSLAANATTGFAGIPNCNAAPTGTPTLVNGSAFMCYNTATHNLNIYDQGASSWYHVTLTAGGA